MGLFFRHATEGDGRGAAPEPVADDDFIERSRQANDLLCDEESLDDGR